MTTLTKIIEEAREKFLRSAAETPETAYLYIISEINAFSLLDELITQAFHVGEASREAEILKSIAENTQRALEDETLEAARQGDKESN